MQLLIRCISWQDLREKYNGKVVIIHTMNLYMGSRGTAPLILNLNIIWRCQLHVPAALSPVPSEQEVGWVLQPVQTFKKILTYARIRTTDIPHPQVGHNTVYTITDPVIYLPGFEPRLFPTHRLVTILSILSQPP